MTDEPSLTALAVKVGLILRCRCEHGRGPAQSHLTELLISYVAPVTQGPQVQL